MGSGRASRSDTETLSSLHVGNAVPPCGPSALARSTRVQVGLVLHLHHLTAHLDVRANIEVAMLGTGRSRETRRRGADALFELVDLSELDEGGEHHRSTRGRARAPRGLTFSIAWNSRLPLDDDMASG